MNGVLHNFACVTFLLLSFLLGNSTAAQEHQIKEPNELKQICKTVLGFPFNEPYLEIVDGGSFTFNSVGRDPLCASSLERGEITASFDDLGILEVFSDGEQVPLVFGSMPRHAEDIERLKDVFNLSKNDSLVMHSLNLPFEVGWGGEGDLVKKDSTLNLRHLPTVDNCAPNLIDAIRLMHELTERGKGPHKLHYVHCLAGRGRSAAMVVLYIMCCLYKIGKQLDPEQDPERIEKYLQRSRPQVALTADQKRFLKDMCILIPGFKGIDRMYTTYSDKIRDRDIACDYTRIAHDTQFHSYVYTGIKSIALLVAGVLFMAHIFS